MQTIHLTFLLRPVSPEYAFYSVIIYQPHHLPGKLPSPNVSEEVLLLPVMFLASRC